MEPIRIKNPGSHGVNKDLSVHELPLGIWTDANNIRFLDGYAYQFPGVKEAYTPPSITPYFILPYTKDGERHWLYAGVSAVYDTYLDGTGTPVHTDVSGATYSAAPNTWVGVVLGGVPILNNGQDAPIRWDTDLVNNFVTLDNWQAGVTCDSLRSYGQFLVALNVAKSGTKYPYMVKWSHPAAPGTAPASWDETDPDYAAGEWNLADGVGPIIDGLELRDSFMIYCEKSIHRMDYIGGSNIFKFTKVLGTSGAMSRNCIVEFDGVHFVLTNDDVIVHDGQSPVSVLNEKTRRFLFRDISAEYKHRSFVVKNPFFNEIYICYPTVGNTSCDKALVWNYVNKTISFYDLPNVYHGDFGAVEQAVVNDWDSDTESWDSDTTLWNDAEAVPYFSRVLLASADTKLYLMDLTRGSTPLASFLERQGMSFGRPENHFLLQGIYLRVKGDDGATLRIRIGGHDLDPYKDPTYDVETIYTIGEDIYVDALVDRRYLAIKIENIDASEFRIDSLDMHGIDTGEW